MNPNGNGLGLSISRSIAKGLDGDIVVESVYGKGATFNFSIKAIVAELPISNDNVL